MMRPLSKRRTPETLSVSRDGVGVGVGAAKAVNAPAENRVISEARPWKIGAMGGTRPLDGFASADISSTRPEAGFHLKAWAIREESNWEQVVFIIYFRWR
jgi:hypothetical protein